MGFINSLFGGENKFKAKGVDVEQGATTEQVNQALATSQGVQGQQQDLANQMAGTQAVANQQNVLGQQQNLSNYLAGKSGADNINYSQAQQLGQGAINQADRAAIASIDFNQANQAGQGVQGIQNQAVLKSQDPNVINYNQANQANALTGALAGMGAQQAQNQNLINYGGANQMQGQANQALQGMLGVASGQGPNPAQAQYQQNVAQAIQAQAGGLASQRGINPAMAARLAAQGGSQQLQGAASNAAILQAQQQIAAQTGAGNLATGLAGQQVQMGASQQAAQAQQQALAQQASMGLGAQYAQQAGQTAQQQLAQAQLAGQLGTAQMGQYSQNAIAQGQLGLAGAQAAGNLYAGQAGLATQQAQAQAAMQQQYAGMTQQQQQAMAGLTTQQVQQLMGQQNTMGQQGLSQQSILQQALANYNQQNIGQNQGINQINAGVASQNAQANSALVGGIVSGAAGAASMFSDERLKQNIRRGGEVAPGVQSAEWQWMNGLPGAGVVAQDVQRVYPELVHQDVTGYQKVDYVGLLQRQPVPVRQFAAGGMASNYESYLRNSMGNKQPDNIDIMGQGVSPGQLAPPPAFGIPGVQSDIPSVQLQSPILGAMPVGADADKSKVGEGIGKGLAGIGGAMQADTTGAFNRFANMGLHAAPTSYFSPTANMEAGGKVPGRAKHPGDNLKNDTVDAKLSPGEIVIPRSVVQSANPGEAAKQFVEEELDRAGSAFKKHMQRGHDTGDLLRHFKSKGKN